MCLGKRDLPALTSPCRLVLRHAHGDSRTGGLTCINFCIKFLPFPHPRSPGSGFSVPPLSALLSAPLSARQVRPAPISALESSGQRAHADGARIAAAGKVRKNATSGSITPFLILTGEKAGTRTLGANSSNVPAALMLPAVLKVQFAPRGPRASLVGSCRHT